MSATTSSHNPLVQIYKSRSNLLKILQQVYGYKTDSYTGFSIAEVDIMEKNEQLDILLSDVSKIYIKYYLSKALNLKDLQQLVEDLFVNSDTLKKEDCLCIVYGGEPNDSLYKHLEYFWNREGYFIVVLNIKRLQFNILEHQFTPELSILTTEQVTELMKKVNIDTLNKLPEISRYDPLALSICLRPGQVCKFLRKSPTCLEAPYYRYCV
jgi:DNA-directed RNA polymerase subunit H (RpoH/RPB5)